MIDKLKLKNIEIHKDSLFEFAPGVTFITGPSDNGKSTVCKAFSWIVKNRPSGTSLVQRKTTEAAATIQADRVRVTREMHVVKKSRRVKLNRYRVNRGKYKALDTRVPEQVDVALNMNEINIQGQFEQFFLLQDTPGIVAKKFNDIMGLEIIDDTLKKANQFVNKVTSDHTAGLATVEMLLGDLEAFVHLPKIEKAVKVIEALDKEADEKRRKVHVVEGLLIQHEEAEEEIEKAEKIAGAEKEAKAGIALQTFSDETRYKILKVQKQISLYNTNDEAVYETEKWLNIENHIPELQTLMELVKDRRGKIDRLSTIVSLYHRADDNVGVIAGELLEASENLETWKQKNPNCPTCNKEW